MSQEGLYLGTRNILLNGAPLRKVMWISIIFIGTGLSVYHLFQLSLDFKMSAVLTRINTIHTPRQRFPAVTFCNLNHLRKTVLAHNPIYAVIAGLKDSTHCDSITDGQVVFKLLEKLGQEHVLNQMEMETKSQHSHQLEHMLMSCTFYDQPCDIRNFTSFYNSDYGNCFSFVPEKLQSMVGKSGTRYGLVLELHVQLDEYIAKFSDTVGFKISVMEENTYPFSNNNGFIIAPGTYNFISIKKILTTQVGPPYSYCFMPKDNFHGTVNETYTTYACSKTCYQRHLLSSCGCYSPRYYHNTPRFQDIIKVLQVEIKPCAFGKDECADNITHLYEDDLICNTECPPPCNETTFDYHTSFGNWPIDNQLISVTSKFKHRLRTVGINLPHTVNKAKTPILKEYIRNNFVKLNVFFDRLSYQHIESFPSHSWFEFLADVGGQASLWLGCSFLSIFKGIELIVAVCRKTEQQSDKMKTSTNTTATNEFLV